MDPDGNYETRLSYTTVTSSDNKVDALRDASNDPADTGSKQKRGGLDASAPPMSQLSIVADDGTRKPSPIANVQAKNFSPPDESALNSVVVPIDPATDDVIPVAFPIVTNTSGAGPGVALPETPGNFQASSGEHLSDRKESRSGNNICSTKKIVIICLALIVLAGVAAGVTIYFLPGQSPEEESKHMTLHDFYPDCYVPNENWIGNGKCDGLPYNSEVCGWDGGDCSPKTNGGQGGIEDEAIGDNGGGGGDNDGLVEPDDPLDNISNGSNPNDDGGGEEEVDTDNDEGVDTENSSPTSTVGDVLNDPNEIDNKASIYPDCGVRDISKVGDAHCDKGVFNTAVCGWDGGDCLKEDWPNCYITDPISLQALGDGVCNGYLDFLECGFDLGDCKPDMNVEKLKELVNDYPGCYFEGMKVEDFADGFCDDWGVDNYNTEECGWDGGDCVVEGYPDCHIEDGWFVGDGDCDGGEYNTEECGWDGGDCDEFNREYPNCQVDYPYELGDGECDDDDDHNTAECGWDGGDCEVEETTEPTPTEEPTGEGSYDATGAGTPLNYPDCFLEWPEYVGDGHCHAGLDPFWYGLYNVEECGWDGGDCDEENALLWKTYPDCKGGVDPEAVGDGHCDGGAHNTAECGWDGGDCEELNRKHPNCDKAKMNLLNNGHCSDFLNTAKCGWDGSDCLFDKFSDEKCNGSVRSTWSNKSRAWCQKKCLDEGSSCKAFDIDVYYESETGRCRIFSKYSSKSSKNDSKCYKKK